MECTLSALTVTCMTYVQCIGTCLDPFELPCKPQRECKLIPNVTTTIIALLLAHTHTHVIPRPRPSFPSQLGTGLGMRRSDPFGLPCKPQQTHSLIPNVTTTIIALLLAHTHTHVIPRPRPSFPSQLGTGLGMRRSDPFGLPCKPQQTHSLIPNVTTTIIALLLTHTPLASFPGYAPASRCLQYG